MGIFNISYKEPERLTPAETRQRRVLSELQRQRQVLRDQERRGLSPANYYSAQLREFENKFSGEIEARRRRVEQLQRDPDNEGRPAHLRAIQRLSQLLQLRSTLQQRAFTEKRGNYLKQASAADARFYHPVPKGQRNARTVFGTEAFVRVFGNPSEEFRRQFSNPLLSIPCIRRAVRRELMFAKKQARGHRTRKRRGPYSMIGC